MRTVNPWIQTNTGKKFDYSNITEESICIEDIAHSLAMQCRYTGHTKEHYSVAQHSIIVSKILPKPLALSGLMHDAAEAYVHDINKPLKDFLDSKKLRDLEMEISWIIYDKFKIQPYHFDCPEIKEADLIVLRAEALQVLEYPPIDNWHENLPKKEILITEWPGYFAEEMFLEVFNELINK